MPMRVRAPVSAWVYGTLVLSVLMVGVGVFVMSDPHGWVASIGSGGVVGGLLESFRQMRDEQNDETFNNTDN